LGKKSGCVGGTGEKRAAGKARSLGRWPNRAAPAGGNAKRGARKSFTKKQTIAAAREKEKKKGGQGLGRAIWIAKEIVEAPRPKGKTASYSGEKKNTGTRRRETGRRSSSTSFSPGSEKGREGRGHLSLQVPCIILLRQKGSSKSRRGPSSEKWHSGKLDI